MSIAGLLRQESATWKAEAERAAVEIQALRLENEALQKRLRINNCDSMRLSAELEEIETFEEAEAAARKALEVQG